MKRIALCGNPNVGKSTIFNKLTGLKQHTGNWTGKTVDLKRGTFTYKDESYEIYDLPGTYSLHSHSKEEEVARDFICSSFVDFTIVVVDASLLERNLNLVLQVLEITNQVIICVNLMDEALKNHISVNLTLLSELLRVPVVGITARNKNEINKLLEEIDRFHNTLEPYYLSYPEQVFSVTSRMESIISVDDFHLRRWLALRLLDDDFEFINKILVDYKIDSDLYLKTKLELLEEGYDVSLFSNLYMKTFSSAAFYIASKVVTCNNVLAQKKEAMIDKILTKRLTGLPVMFLFLMVILWITLVGASKPSDLLFSLFHSMENSIREFFTLIHMPSILNSFLMDGIFRVVTWVVAVMFPPMAIFFPLFTLLEEAGFLPRLAFNLDYCFHKCKSCGKQALTMMMGFGCNAVGVMGSRIIDSKRERLLSILTNVFIPCNGRFPTLISLFTMFFLVGSTSSIWVAFLLTVCICFCIFMTLFITNILSSTILKGEVSSFVLELPHYRKPQIFSILVSSFLSKTLSVLWKAIKASIPAAIVIWCSSVFMIHGENLLSIFSSILNPIGELLGLDGTILLAFLLAFPANEIVVPALLMIYLKNSTLQNITDLSYMKEIFIANGWNMRVACCFLIFMLFHFPCATTLITIKEETKSFKWSVFAFLLPLIVGFILCILCKNLFLLFGM